MTPDRPQRSKPRYDPVASSSKPKGKGAAAKPTYGAHKPRDKKLPTGEEFKKVPSLAERGPEALPGVNKLKASIRQAKRLLAKDGIEPGLRVQTERRLKALEADLDAAGRREVEKKNGAKYHAVKFFERQKLVRLIKRFQRKLEGEKKEKKRTGYEKDLEASRVMLNYILNYPNTTKYIALFPPSAEEKDADEEKEKLNLPKWLNASLEDELDKPARKRLEMLLETRKLMGEGKLSGEPEVERGERVQIGGEEVVRKSTKVEEKKEDEDDFFDEDDE